MIRNYFKIAWRNLWKNKLFSLINVVSLAIGLSASFVIGLMVYHELTFDKFHPDGDRIYRVTTQFLSPTDNSYNSGVPSPLGETLKEGTPGIENAAYFYTYNPANIKIVETRREHKKPENFVYADAKYFEIFEYNWLAGNKNTLLEPNEVVLTEERAKKYFPNLTPEETIGKVLIYNDSVNATVTGIVENFKQRSDLKFEEFVSIKTAAQTDMKDQVFNDSWGSTSSASQLFIKVAENSKEGDVQKQLDAISEEHENENAAKYQEYRKFRLQPLSDLHFNTDYGIFNSSASPANKSTLVGLAFIALFLLLLGCINFINLNTAQATQRAKEIGIRKTLGSSRKQLIFQFLGETLLLTLFAALVSFFLANWLLKIFADFTPKGLDMDLIYNPVVIIAILVLLFLVTLLSGFYPALVLSHFKPVSVMKDQGFKDKGKASIRKFLTVFQFAIAQVFIIATILVGRQIHFLMNKDMGFKTEAIAYVTTPWKDPSPDKRQRLMREIKYIPGVTKTSLGGFTPASGSVNSTITNYFDGEKEIRTELQLLHGDSSYLDLYDIELLAGRNLRNDTIRELIINETYVKQLGFEEPNEVIGELLKYGDKYYPIIGVMEDFHQRTLKSPIVPMALIGEWSGRRYAALNTIHFSLKTDSDWSAVMAKAEEAWKKTYPEADFQVKFMDETIENFYQKERSTAKLLNWATGLSVLVSCLGLLGLVIYTTERRKKEIGIRKVLGATLVQINLLLCKDFLILVGLAFLIAAPIAWWGLNSWLQDFAYKTSLSWWIFILSGGAMLSIAMIIMSIRTLRTAMSNPVESLKTE